MEVDSPSPSSAGSPPPRHCHFKPVFSAQFCAKFPVELYRSTTNGLHLAVCRTDSPLTHVNISLGELLNARCIGLEMFVSAHEFGFSNGVAAATARLVHAGCPTNQAVNFLDQLAAQSFCLEEERKITVEQVTCDFDNSFF